MLNDYQQTDCFIYDIQPQNPNPNSFYVDVLVNYTWNSQSFIGYDVFCETLSEIDTAVCAKNLSDSFPCMVDTTLLETKDVNNQIFTPSEYSNWQYSKTQTFLIVYLLCFVFVLLFLFLYRGIDFIMEKFGLEKLTDDDLGLSVYLDYILRTDGQITEMLLHQYPLDRKVRSFLEQTAPEKMETIEWIYKPPMRKLITSHSWIVGIYTILGVIPLVGLLLYFAIYSLIQFPWKIWALILVELMIFYCLFVFLTYVFLFLWTANHTVYYLTDRRSITVMRCPFTTWVYQYPHSDIKEIQKLGENSGTLFAMSKRFQIHVKLFSYVEDFEQVLPLLNSKITTGSMDEDLVLELQNGAASTDEQFQVGRLSTDAEMYHQVILDEQLTLQMQNKRKDSKTTEADSHSTKIQKAKLSEPNSTNSYLDRNQQQVLPPNVEEEEFNLE